MELIRVLLRQSRLLVVLSALGGLGHGLVHVGLLFLIYRWLSTAGQAEGLGLRFLGVLLLLPVFKVSSEVTLARLAQRAIFDLRMQMVDRVVAAPLARLEASGTGTVLKVLTDDLQYVVGSLIQFPYMWTNFIIVVVSFSFLVFLSWKLVVCILLLVALGIYTWRIVLRRAAENVSRAAEEQKKLFEHFDSLVGGMKELKLDSALREALLLEHLRPAGERHRRFSVGEFVVWSTGGAWTFTLLYSILGLVVFALPGPLGYDSQVALAFVLVVLFALAPLDGLMNQFIKVGPATQAFRRANAVLDALAEEPEPVGTVTEGRVPASWNEVRLQGVSWHPLSASESPPLGPLDLTLRRGELVFVSGPPGSGKSTLAKLVSGLYWPTAGQVLVDGQPISGEARQEYREHSAAIFADSHWFAGLGRPPASADGELAELARAFQVDGTIPAGEGSAAREAFTVEQRRRLALLDLFTLDRALYVLDEWTLGQDPELKEVFYRRFLPELRRRGKLVLVTTNEERYFDIADRRLNLTSSPQNGRNLTDV